MSFDLRIFTEVLITLFVIMDPPGTVPVFLGLTSGMTRQERARAARQAVAVAFGVIALFALAGPAIMSYMHISVEALQASGGLLLLLVALELLTGKLDGPTEKQSTRANVAMVPLGTPLLAGPGAIVAVMLFIRRADGDPGALLAIFAGVLVIHVVVWAAMRFANVVHRILKDSGTILVSRIAGLLLAAIAVQLIGDAIKAFFNLG